MKHPSAMKEPVRGVPKPVTGLPPEGWGDRDDLPSSLCDRLAFLEHVDRALGQLTGGPFTLAVLSTGFPSAAAAMAEEGMAEEGMADLIERYPLDVAAQRLCSGVRSGDVVAWTRDGEFALLCGELASYDEAVAIARRVLAILDEPFVLGEGPVWIRCKVGVAFPFAADDSPEALLERSHQAMHASRMEPSPRYDVTLGSLPPRPLS